MHKYDDIRWSTCCPAFIIGTTLNTLGVWGAVFADRFFFELVKIACPGSLLGDAARINSNTRGHGPFEGSILEICQTFRAISEAIADFKNHEKSVESPPIRRHEPGANDPETPVGPAPGQFPRWNSFESDFSGTSKTYTITYKYRLATHFDKPVYRATMKASDVTQEYQVVVKFHYRYGAEGHKLLAKARLAPELYFASVVGPESNGPDMWAVVMEYIEGEKADFEKASRVQKNKLREAVEILHGAGFVHGNLQESNIVVCEQDKLYLVDFNRCGEENKAKYPWELSKDDGPHQHEGASMGQLIEKEHDLHSLNSMLGGEAE